MTPRCGVCGWSFSERTLTKHAETACGQEDIKAKPFNYCDGCSEGLQFKQWHYIAKGHIFLCHECNESRRKL
jgi:hypothetical protein